MLWLDSSRLAKRLWWRLKLNARAEGCVRSGPLWVYSCDASAGLQASETCRWHIGMLQAMTEAQNNDGSSQPKVQIRLSQVLSCLPRCNSQQASLPAVPSGAVLRTGCMAHEACGSLAALQKVRAAGASSLLVKLVMPAAHCRLQVKMTPLSACQFSEWKLQEGCTNCSECPGNITKQVHTSLGVIGQMTASSRDEHCALLCRKVMTMIEAHKLERLRLS